MRWHLDLEPPARTGAVLLDADQRRVVAHRDGPLLVLAGPGTGKTTTIVEAICARLDDPDEPLPADAVLALTFGRRAAAELRDRVTARLGGGIVPTVTTFHSFAYGLLRRTESPEQYLNPPRLMSGSEEDVRIRELLVGAVEDGRIAWPAELVDALPTLGLANEVRAVLARARELGLEDSDLQRIGSSSGRPAWAAIGAFAREEQQVMLLENVMDYAELLFRALLRAHDPHVRSGLHRQYRAVFVDEYQDTDRLQVAMLKALVGPGCAIVAVGDPDQAIYGFRGADVGGLLRFPESFRTGAGDPAPVVVLRHTRRFGPTIRHAAASVFAGRRPVGLPAERMHEHRNPLCDAREPDDDAVALRVYDDVGALAAHVAHEIRATHVRRAVPWRELAVLVRAGSQIPRLQRALSGAGIPVVVAADEIPLRSEPAVATLLLVLRLAADPRTASPADIHDVLTGPLVGLTASEVRRLGRALRTQRHRPGFATPASDVLIRDLVLGDRLADASAGSEAPLPLAGDDPVAVAVDRLVTLLGHLHQQLVEGGAPEDVLWSAWTGGPVPHGWPNRLRSAALSGSRSAHHDLDAVIALFDAAERLTGRYPGFLGVRTFLDSLAAQQIPAEPVADRGTMVDSVRILTAHRAKGLEWDEVWVVGAQEGVWPDLRARGSSLRAEELSGEGIGRGPRPADLLEEERRLFFVACTRARRRLHLAVVDEQDAGGEQPSRFVADVQAGMARAGRPLDDRRIGGRPPFPLSLDGLVAELRSTAQDPAADPALRAAAVARLALLAAQRDDDGEPLVPLADPQHWWGIRAPTAGVQPVRDPDRPISLSGSGLDGVLSCPLHWFLDHEVHAETPRGPATAFGSVVHAVADFVAKGEVPADLDLMDAEVDRVWAELRFEAPWQSQSERRDAREALRRFLGYHEQARRELVTTEARVGTVLSVPTPAGADTVALTGFIDRVERDDDGRLVPIDLKNMRRGVPKAEIPGHGQLGVYQLILREAGLTAPDEPDQPAEVGGAALVQLRLDERKGSPSALEQFQPAIGEERPSWVESRLGEAAHVLRTEAFTAITGRHCRYCAFATSCPAQPEGEQVTP